MPNHLHKITDDKEALIIAAIRAGAFPHIAAEAAGIPHHVFSQWLEWADQPRNKKYRAFKEKVSQAQAQARLKAEMSILENEPRLWLRNGPGKETPDRPGWTAVVKPMITEKHQTINLFGSPDFISFMATLRQVLAPFPDALKAITHAIDNQPTEPTKLPTPKPPIDPSLN